MFLTATELRVSLKKTWKTAICPQCGKRFRRVESVYERTVRDLDCVGRKTFITYPEYKITCRSCGYRGVEKLDFVDRYSFFTRRFEGFAALLCEKMTLKDVSSVCGIGWKSAKAIDKKALAKLVVGLDGLNPSRLGVDEVAYQKGHNYLTIVRDLDLGKVLWIGIGRKKETLDSFFAELGPQKCGNITAFVMDMWDPYIASVKTNCPNADIVFDKFHIAKKVNDALDEIRKKEFRKADSEERKDMKHKRFLILSRQERLNAEDKGTVEDLQRINQHLYQAYLLKEQALNILDEKDQTVATERFNQWTENVTRLGITEYLSVIKTMQHYWYGVANYFKHHITNAGAEGFNNKINVIKRKAYGYRDLFYFKLKILQSCGWRRTIAP